MFSHILFQLSYIIFTIGVIGIIINRKNLLLVFMSLELIVLAINLYLLGISLCGSDIVAQIMLLYVLSIAAAEAAIGLSILVAYFRIKGNIAMAYNRLARAPKKEQAK